MGMHRIPVARFFFHSNIIHQNVLTLGNFKYNIVLYRVCESKFQKLVSYKKYTWMCENCKTLSTFLNIQLLVLAFLWRRECGNSRLGIIIKYGSLREFFQQIIWPFYELFLILWYKIILTMVLKYKTKQLPCNHHKRSHIFKTYLNYFRNTSRLW